MLESENGIDESRTFDCRQQLESVDIERVTVWERLELAGLTREAVDGAARTLDWCYPFESMGIKRLTVW